MNPLIRVAILLRSSLFVLLVFPIITIGLSLIAIIWYMITRNRKLSSWAAMTWCRLCLWFLNIRVQHEGIEHLPRGGCLLLFSHTSFVDIFALASRVFELRFGAKLELFSIPIFGQALRSAGALPIARQNRQRAIKVLQDAVDRAKAGEKFALAPEGARSESETVLLPFKAGPFIFAIDSNIPVVPVVIRGATEAWPKGSIIPCLNAWAQEVRVIYLKPISTEGFTVDTRQSLSERVRTEMLPYFPNTAT